LDEDDTSILGARRDRCRRGVENTNAGTGKVGMDLVVGIIGWLCVELVFYGLFYAIGWSFIKMVTLGRHPGPWRGAESFVDAELVAFTGIIVTLVVILVAWKYLAP